MNQPSCHGLYAVTDAVLLPDDRLVHAVEQAKMCIRDSPLPSASTTHATESVATTDQAYWRSHAENMLAAMLSDAVRQLQAERQTQTHNPRSPHGNSAPSGELPAGLRVAPLIIIENGGDPSRPVLIRL